MRILLATISEQVTLSLNVEIIAEALGEAGHEVDLFIAPANAALNDEFEFQELKKQLHQTISALNPDVIECLAVDNIGLALSELGYAYIVDLSEQTERLKLVPQENDGQIRVIGNASFVFTQNESQRTVIAEEFQLESDKLVTMPWSAEGHLIAERLAYYQLMLLRHSLH